jgi:hypothetical protein
MVDCNAKAPGLRTVAERDLHERIVAQPIEVDWILVPARDRGRARHHHLEHLMPDAVRIAALRLTYGDERFR